MSYKITDKCINCGACAGECPVSAIKEAGEKHDIAPDVCVDCGACESTCPVGAIEPSATK